MGRARFLLYPWFIFFVTDQTQISLGQNDATYDAKRSCTETFVNILFYSWKKTIEFNCEKKAVVNTNIILSFIIFMPIHIGKKVRLLRHRRFHNSYDWWCNRGFHNGYKWYGAIRGLNSSCVVVVSCRLMKWFCVLSHQWINKKCLQARYLKVDVLVFFLKACTKTENSHVKD